MPLAHGLLFHSLLAKQVVVNVVAPLCPRVDHFPLHFDKSIAEPTPEAWVAVPTQPAAFQFVLDLLAVRKLVVVEEMRPEQLSTRQHLVAERHIAVPGLKLKMLATLMSFPVILAAKVLIACLVSAAVGFLMPFHVLPKTPYKSHAEG